MKGYVIAIALTATLVACGQSGQSTAIVSGKPVVVVHNASVTCVHERLLARAAEHGWNVVSVSESALVAERKSPAWLNTAARSAGYESPLVRMTLTITPTGPNVQVVVDPFAITNPGLRNERVEPIKATAEMQATFNDAGRQIEEHCGRK